MFEYNTIEEALEALRNGEIILVTDDENRENEGDMICAAEFATTENLNFMATHAKGLICMPMSIELCEKLLRFRSTILTPQREFLLPKEDLLREWLLTIMPNPTIFGVRGICFL